MLKTLGDGQKKKLTQYFESAFLVSYKVKRTVNPPRILVLGGAAEVFGTVRL